MGEPFKNMRRTQKPELLSTHSDGFVLMNTVPLSERNRSCPVLREVDCFREILQQYEEISNGERTGVH